MKFAGTTAIITGAGNGIGRSTALKLAGEGANVALVDVDQVNVERVAETIRSAGGTALTFAVDVTHNDNVKAVVAKVLATFGQVDILVNNAGAGWREQIPFKDTPDDSWEWILDLNIKGTLYFTRAVANHMVGRRSGKIINVASIAAKTGIPNLAVYSASKGAVVSFTKALAMELGPYDINVSCISPGLITNEAVAPATKGNFLERQGTADEVASLITFLASDEAAYITGADYLIDGGRSLGPRGA